jgi:hypothetical protein
MIIIIYLNKEIKSKEYYFLKIKVKLDLIESDL